MSEFDFIANLRTRLASSPLVDLGLGDDAALLSSALLNGNQQLVVTTDIVMDGTDFLLHACGYRVAGRKALAVNLSDIAAMAAEPVAAFVGLVLPKSSSKMDAIQLMSGIEDLAREFDVVVAGGDTNSWDGPLAVSITLMGRVEQGRAITRSAAQSGDVICVTGPLGGSILGHHLNFTPRIREARWLAANYPIHAMLDLSDGLSSDLQHIIQESHVGMLLEDSSIPISEAAHRLAQQSGFSPLEHALHDGEDFELLFTITPEDFERLAGDLHKPCLAKAIGSVTAFPVNADSACQIKSPDGSMKILPVRGYRHQLQDDDGL